LEQAPAFVGQLLSPESLRRTGYFQPEAVEHWRKTFRNLRGRTAQRLSVEMGLVGVAATQLWHHTFIDGSLAELPSAVGSKQSAVGSRQSAVSSRR
jgi:asparagine synthase (glutamine-hydrolysing)